jgi:coenzyme F420-reducing hydrogenase delta subunit
MPGDCHYLEGNVNAKRRITHMKAILAEIGLEPERVEMFNLSAAMASEFVRITEEMMERMKKLGPNPLRLVGRREIKRDHEESEL